MPPLVTAIIPTFNYAHFVTEAVDSALAQTHTPIEVIVVDDGSTDDTRERLKPYLDRIRYIYQKNAGIAAARNTGIQHAKGEWIALLDSDDTWHPQKTEIQLAAVGNDKSIGFVGSPKNFEMPAILPEHPEVRELGLENFISRLPMGPSSAMVRRECFDVIGLFDSTVTPVEDREMWMRLATRYRSLQVCSPCWRYRHHVSQASRNAQKMFNAYYRVINTFFRKHSEHRNLRRQAMAYLYVDAAMSFRESGRKITGLLRIAQSIWYSPFGLKFGRVRQPISRSKFILSTMISLGRIRGKPSHLTN